MERYKSIEFNNSIAAQAYRTYDVDKARELITKIHDKREKKKQRDTESINELCRYYYLMVLKILVPYRNFEKYEDIAQSALFGLCQACSKVDKKVSRKELTTYIKFWCIRYIQEELDKLDVVNETRIVNSIVAWIHRNNYFEKTLEELDALWRRNHATKVTQKLFLSALTKANAPDIISIDAHLERVNKDDRAVKSTILANDKLLKTPSDLDRMSIKEMFNLFTKTTRNLTPKEKKVIKYRFLSGDKITLEEIASKLKITPERVRQIEFQALKKYRYSEYYDDLKQDFKLVS